MKFFFTIYGLMSIFLSVQAVSADSRFQEYNCITLKKNGAHQTIKIQEALDYLSSSEGATCANAIKLSNSIACLSFVEDELNPRNMNERSQQIVSSMSSKAQSMINKLCYAEQELPNDIALMKRELLRIEISAPK